MRAAICIVLFITSIAVAKAQTKFGGGVSVGLAVSQVSGDNLSGFNKPGAFAGVFGNYAFNSRNWFQAEINFIQRGSYKAPKDEDNTLYSLNLNYIEVPLLYKIMPKGNHFIFEIGPAISYLVSARERSEIGEITTNPPFKQTALDIQGGINYRLGKGFLLNFRASQSILQVRNHQGDVNFRLNRGQYLSTLSFTLRYDFNTENN